MADVVSRIAEVSAFCRKNLDHIDRALEAILDAAIDLTGADKGNIQLLEPSGALVIRTQRGFSEEFLTFFAEVRDEASTCGVAARTGEPIVVEDVTKHEPFAKTDALGVMLRAGSLALQLTPLTNSAGEVVGMISTHFDRPHRLTDAELAAVKLLAGIAADYLEHTSARERARLDQQRMATRLRLALGAAQVGVWQSDQASGQAYGPEFNEILGFPGDRALTADEIRSRYLPGEFERIRGITRAAFARGERHSEVEARVRRLDGEVRWLLLRGELTQNEEGQPRGFVGVAMDVTERKEAEERMKLLAQEVDHRANNLLAVVQSIVQLSTASTPEALKHVLLGRVTALGRAHQLLSEARWEGADLKRLVEEELLAFGLGDAARFSIHGEHVGLSPAAAQEVAMALHELATNASKHGALSAPTGRVDVSWSRVGSGPLTIRWVESGGPPVAPPTHSGLGVSILTRALSGALKGGTTMDWRPEGLVCEMTLSGEAVETR